MTLKGELNFAGSITKVEYQAEAAASNAQFYAFEMKLCHTSLNVLTTNFQNNYNGNTPVVVGTANPLTLTVSANQWFGVNCSPAFNYNNNDNLIVEVRWQNSGSGTSVETWGYDCGSMRLLTYKDYNAETGDLTSKIDRFRFTYSGSGVAATSYGRVKSLYR